MKNKNFTQKDQSDFLAKIKIIKDKIVQAIDKTRQHHHSIFADFDYNNSSFVFYIDEKASQETKKFFNKFCFLFDTLLDKALNSESSELRKIDQEETLHFEGGVREFQRLFELDGQIVQKIIKDAERAFSVDLERGISIVSIGGKIAFYEDSPISLDDSEGYEADIDSDSEDEPSKNLSKPTIPQTRLPVKGRQ